jgi:NAD(P)-dependent dehydrogenase (short-subunit alcohol dehydrogenase family)
MADFGTAGLLAGAKAIVTGGAHGIGSATAARFVDEGARVAIVDIDGDAAASTAAEVGASAVVVADVADPEAATAAFDAAAEQLGGLTVVFNNAGAGMAKPLHRYTDDEFARMIGVNLAGTFHCIRAAVPHLIAAGGGAIVNMAGTTAARPARGEGPYAAAKAGIVALTKEAALEYGPAIRVNCVSPGYIATRLTERILADDALRDRIESRIPLGRIGAATEVAAAVVFLCSPMASYVTGHVLDVDGGSLLPSHQSDELLKALLSRFD